ncbi:MAG TPA: reductase [Leclercia sp.]|uniref:Reductase n=1 Tax=Leclercia adecarboxylata TaxID=83655 RepID=A0AAP9AL15_9ENTR|nr:reductase [Leclercia adecarboxylata]HCN96913.1 reductase [Leclercia sp.]
MKKSCQLCNRLFLKGQHAFHCTKSVAMSADCTITKHCFGAALRHH